MRPNSILVATAIAFVAQSACRQRAVPASVPSGKDMASLEALGYVSSRQVQAPRAEVKEPAASIAPPPSGPSRLAASQLKIIRNGSLRVEVKSFKDAFQEATRIATNAGGYVANTTSNEGTSGRENGSMSLRVPASSFAAMLDALRKLGSVVREDTSTQDVTKEYADLETRARVKRDTAERLRIILRDRTGALDDVLAVERELARVTEEIERIEGERKYYDNLVSLSTIQLDLYEPASVVSPSIFGSIRRAFRESLEALGQSFSAMMIFVAAALPWFVALVAAWKLANWWWRRRNRARAGQTSSGT